MKRIENWAISIVSSSPRIAGWLAFIIIFCLTLVISIVEYQLRLSSEREKVTQSLYEFENLLTNALNDGISAVKTLAFIAQNQQDYLQNFENIGKQILDSNPHVDVLQILDSGTIVGVYPEIGNEAVLGYNVLEDPAVNGEVEEAILRKDIYFSGPIQLRQGGTGILGRYPIFTDGKFEGLAAVIIYFDDLLKLAYRKQQEEHELFFQLSKVNSNTGVLEKFIPETDNYTYTGYQLSRFIELGNLTLTVQLKESKALKGMILQLLIRLLGSALFGLVIWNFARQPHLLRKKVSEQSEEILKVNERFEFASKATSDVLWDWDIVSDQVYRSDHFFELLGYSSSEITANNSFWRSIVHPDDFKSVESHLNDTLAGTDQFWTQEVRVRKQDGTYAYIVDKGFIIRNSAGEPIRLIGAFQDISVRKAAELELMEVNQRLGRANEELKIFAALASHDLREPLRMISSFMTLLEKKYGAQLDEKANQYISFAIDGARRLTTLINDLLEYSKIGFDAELIEQIDTNALVHDVLRLKSTLITESGAIVKVESLPDIQGVKTPIQLVFQNLIGNALKYRNLEVSPLITISGRDLNDFWEFSVADNGIGIEANYLEFIFGLSKRIHSKEKYPGNGMGLATCRKIVSQHGGRIWVESTPGEGSTFLFTIRKHQIFDNPAGRRHSLLESLETETGLNK